MAVFLSFFLFLEAYVVISFIIVSKLPMQGGSV